MSKIKRFSEADGDFHGELGFNCPGCNSIHFINDEQTTIQGKRANGTWTFNGDYERPTVRASVLACVYRKNPDSGNYDIEYSRCHSFVTDGKIEFLNDCTHELAGQTVELPEI